MSKLMWIAGILLTAAGAALGLMVVVSPASIDGLGITMEMASILLVGGVLSLGLGSVISLLAEQRSLLAGQTVVAAAPPPAAIPEYGRRAETASTTAAPSARAAEDVSEPTRDTIKALEQARQKIEQAFEPKPEQPAAAQAALQSRAENAERAPSAEDAQEEVEEVPAQLYVVEERFIRMRPARILSDGTVEAETEEGWMRFENLEHLDEYLDAMEPAKS